MAQAAKSTNTTGITVESLRTMSLRELDTLLDAVKAAGAGWLSIANQPRSRDKRIEEIIGIEVDRCQRLQDAIAKEAAARKPADFGDAEYRARILISELVQGDDWREIMEIATATALAAQRAIAKAA